jgi:comEA protein
MPGESVDKSIGSLAGTVAMIVLIGFLIAWGMAVAFQRTVPLDESPIGARVADDTGSDALPDMRVRINSASPAELSVLPGIGPALAHRIAEHRERHGRFATVDDLQSVSGIGVATIDRLRPYAISD